MIIIYRSWLTGFLTRHHCKKDFQKCLLISHQQPFKYFLGYFSSLFTTSCFYLFWIGLIALVILIFRLTYNCGISTSLEESNYKYEVGNWLEEVARTIKTFKFMGVTEYPSRELMQWLVIISMREKNILKILKIQYWSFVFFKLIITAALLIIGSFLVIEQQINIGQFIAAEIVIITLLNSEKN